MNENNKYSGDKTKNYFTAYLLQFVRGRRARYLDKKISSDQNSFSVDEVSEIPDRNTLEEIWELRQREQLLLREVCGDYPKWDELSDRKLTKALYKLSKTERWLIYLHVFEGHTLKHMSEITGMEQKKCKETYYYAINKIRKSMGVKKR